MPANTVVIYNPAAGRGRAAKVVAGLAAMIGEHTLLPTEKPGHAELLALAAADTGCERVVAVGGDGTAHEVANGLLASANRAVVFAALPAGSMNDYAFTTGLGRWTGREPLAVISADVGVVRGGGRERHFINGCGVGFAGMVTMESRKIRRLSGHLLYTVAFVRAGLRHFATPTLTVRFDDVSVAGPTLAVSCNLAQREGGFPLTPRATLDDGLFDTFHARGAKRWQLARYLPGLLRGTLPADHPVMRFGRCRTAAVSGDTPLAVHVDGELFCVPADGITAVEMELLPGRLRVQVCPAYQYGK